MTGNLLNSTSIDTEGNQLVLDNTILDVFYYDTTSESWDKTGSGSKSWVKERKLPIDLFTTSSIDSSKWSIVNSLDNSSLTIVDGIIKLGAENSEGVYALSSSNVWKLVGDFDIRLDIDLTSYYNEYRSITSSYLKVAKDNSNAARVSFKFDGEDSFSIVSEYTVDRDLRFFDWTTNGSSVSSSVISTFTSSRYFRIVRTSGIIKTFLFNGVTQTQIGPDIVSNSLQDPVFVEFGVENKERNTLRTSFGKFIVISGTTQDNNIFPSSVRGIKEDFPDRCLLVVDNQSLSIIDISDNSLWMRLLTGANSPVPDSTFKISACEGVVYCTTTDGLVALDFPNDSILKYKGTNILKADVPIAARNSGVNFDIFYPNIGNIQNNNIHDVDCGRDSGQLFVVFTNDYGVIALRPTASGVFINNQSGSPGDRVHMSETGNLYWSSYDDTNDEAELSVFTSLSSLTSSSTLTFSRNTFYTRDTTLSFLGNRINTISTTAYGNTELIALGSDVGVSFIGFSPATPTTHSVSYGVLPPPENPVNEPNFSGYIGNIWKPFYRNSLHSLFSLRKDSTVFTPEGSSSLRLQFRNTTTGQFYQAGTVLGVEQEVDFSGLDILFFDIKLENAAGTTNFWNLEILADDILLKSYRDIDAPFERLNDFINTSDLDGIYNFTVRLRMLADTNSNLLTGKVAYITNFKTLYSPSTYPVLPFNALNVREVLLQYEERTKKIYFSSVGGYGVIDLERNDLDYFVASSTINSDATVQSADFSRISNDI